MQIFFNEIITFMYLHRQRDISETHFQNIVPYFEIATTLINRVRPQQMVVEWTPVTTFHIAFRFLILKLVCRCIVLNYLKRQHHTKHSVLEKRQ